LRVLIYILYTHVLLFNVNWFLVNYTIHETTNKILLQIPTRIISLGRILFVKYRRNVAHFARQKCAFVQMIVKWNVRRRDVSPNCNNEP